MIACRRTILSPMHTGKEYYSYYLLLVDKHSELQNRDDLNSLFRGIGVSELSDPFDSDDDFEVDGAEDVDVIVRKHDDKFVDTSDSELDDDANDAEMDTSFSAPPYSPICPSHFNKESFLDNIDSDVIGDQNLK